MGTIWMKQPPIVLHAILLPRFTSLAGPPG
jgi:hypothetical protein